MNATASLTKSGITKGVTHHPRTVARPIVPVDFMYTTINQAVPNAYQIASPNKRAINLTMNLLPNKDVNNQ